MLNFLDLYGNILNNGSLVSPRGMKVLELEDYQLKLHPINDRFTSFNARKMNIPYAKKEIAWYFRGDRHEMTILEAAAVWKNIIDEDGGINSNYGQYIYHDQSSFDWVVEELARDKNSRRAIIPLLNHTHLRQNNPDVVCTYAIGFRIRHNKLNMSIHMRSWDAIWGMTNDVFCFSVIYETVYVYLKWFYPDLEYGTYVHTADSVHVYERHFDMLEQLVVEGMTGYFGVDCPKIHAPEEVEWLIEDQGKTVEPDPRYEFSRWLFDR